MNDLTETRSRIHSFILETFRIAKKRGVRDEDRLLESGIVDSLGVLDVVTFLERAFAIRIQDEELTPENFGSIQELTAFVQKKRTDGEASVL